METERGFGIILALLLMIQFSLGNLLSSSPNLVSVFPWLVGLLVLPVVLWPAIRRLGVQRHGEALAVQAAREIGWDVTGYAAVIFGVYAAIFSWFYFSGPARVSLSGIGLAIAVLATLVGGLLWSEVCARAIVRRVRSPVRPPKDLG